MNVFLDFFVNRSGSGTPPAGQTEPEPNSAVFASLLSALFGTPTAPAPAPSPQTDGTVSFVAQAPGTHSPPVLSPLAGTTLALPGPIKIHDAPLTAAAPALADGFPLPDAESQPGDSAAVTEPAPVATGLAASLIAAAPQPVESSASGTPAAPPLPVVDTASAQEPPSDPSPPAQRGGLLDAGEPLGEASVATTAPAERKKDAATLEQATLLDPSGAPEPSGGRPATDAASREARLAPFVESVVQSPARGQGQPRTSPVAESAASDVAPAGQAGTQPRTAIKPASGSTLGNDSYHESSPPAPGEHPADLSESAGEAGPARQAGSENQAPSVPRAVAGDPEMSPSRPIVELAPEADVQQLPPDTGADLLERIAWHKSTLSSRNPDQVTLQLKPELLGRVVIHAAMENGQLTTRISVENAQVERFLNDNIAWLRDSLGDLGVKVSRLDIASPPNGALSMQSGGFSQGEGSLHHQGQDRKRVVAPAKEDVEELEEWLPAAAASRLNIRV